MVLKKNTPAFGKLSATGTHLEGQYYNQHLNLITNSEEIAFYKGSVIEKSKLKETYHDLSEHLRDEINTTFGYSVIEDYILKYTWSAWGYVFAGLPVFLEDFWKTIQQMRNNGPVEEDKNAAVNEKQNMRQFVINKRLMLSLADAGSRLMYSIKDISELTGYTDRVFNLLTNLHEVHSPRFDYGSKQGIKDIRGTIQSNYYEGIRFENIPVIIPSTKGSEKQQIDQQIKLPDQSKQKLIDLRI